MHRPVNNESNNTHYAPVSPTILYCLLNVTYPRARIFVYPSLVLYNLGPNKQQNEKKEIKINDGLRKQKSIGCRFQSRIKEGKLFVLFSRIVLSLVFCVFSRDVASVGIFVKCRCVRVLSHFFCRLKTMLCTFSIRFPFCSILLENSWWTIGWWWLTWRPSYYINCDIN